MTTLLLTLVLMLVIMMLTWDNINDLRTMKEYCIKRKTKSQHFVYPWWHNGFTYGGFYVGPWTWSRQQHYYHPEIGWYVSPFVV